MRLFKLVVSISDVAAGAVNSASTRMIPATRIKTTTVMAISTKSKYSRKVVLIPTIDANSSSKRYAFQSLNKATITNTTMPDKISISRRFALVTARILPNR